MRRPRPPRPARTPAACPAAAFKTDVLAGQKTGKGKRSMKRNREDRPGAKSFQAHRAAGTPDPLFVIRTRAMRRAAIGEAGHARASDRLHRAIRKTASTGAPARAHLRRHRSDRPVFRREPSRARQARPGRPARFRISETPGYARPGTAIRSTGAVQRPVAYYLHENPKGGRCSAERLDTNPGRPRYVPRSRDKGSRRAPGSYSGRLREATSGRLREATSGRLREATQEGSGKLLQVRSPTATSRERGSPASRAHCVAPGTAGPGHGTGEAPQKTWFNQWMMTPQGFRTPEGDAPASRGRRAASSSSNAVIGASQRCPSQT